MQTLFTYQMFCENNANASLQDQPPPHPLIWKMRLTEAACNYITACVRWRAMSGDGAVVSGLIGRWAVLMCNLFPRWEATPCCPYAGCLRRASCTGSSPPRAMYGASESFCGRSSLTENSHGFSYPTTRWALTENRC